MEGNFIEKKHYKNIIHSDIINFGKNFRGSFLTLKDNKEIVGLPIFALRIIFKIYNQISFEQFQNNKNQHVQFSLFDEEFKTINNTYARFTFKIKDISDKNDYEGIKKAIEFLENYKKEWYKSINSKGEIIKSYGGLISNPNISKGNITFLMSSFWLEKILDFTTGYNVAFTDVPWKVSNSKHILFYLWLLEIPDNGTSVKFDTIQTAYGFNYKNPHTFVNNFLKSVKNNLDLYSNISFNYSVNSGIISIVKYYTKTINLELKPVTLSNQLITQKLHYWKVRHKLSKENIDSLRNIINLDKNSFNIFISAYNLLVVDYRRKKQKITVLYGNDFLNVFQEYIIVAYKETSWYDILEQGHPKIL